MQYFLETPLLKKVEPHWEQSFFQMYIYRPRDMGLPIVILRMHTAYGKIWSVYSGKFCLLGIYEWSLYKQFVLSVLSELCLFKFIFS